MQTLTFFQQPWIVQRDVDRHGMLIDHDENQCVEIFFFSFYFMASLNFFLNILSTCFLMKIFFHCLWDINEPIIIWDRRGVAATEKNFDKNAFKPIKVLYDK